MKTKNTGRRMGWDDGGSKLITGFAVMAGGFIITYFSFTFLFVLMGIIQIFFDICFAAYVSSG